ncbi:hypothetical protein A8H40_17130 [Burkholderia multivorans]|nr:hypothetical protein A8H40_17130 [Burkholderia multivorans]PRG60353.1 hypothetical protein C6T69_28530 [Burkholderia multivorans]PRH23451.1 hypothetical protein C6T56_05340 [Burkholderia multivorans]
MHADRGRTSTGPACGPDAPGAAGSRARRTAGGASVKVRRIVNRPQKRKATARRGAGSGRL